jgi:hypothetical protein
VHVNEMDWTGVIWHGRVAGMKRSLPWIIAVIATVAFGASYSELQRMRGRFGEVSRHTFHDHRDVREFIIRAAMVGLERPVVVIGDSIVEMARFPENVVNAGIGGATIEDFETVAPRLFEHAAPSVIVVELGTNDDTAANYGRLLHTLKKFSARVVAVAIPKTDAKNVEIKAAADREGVSYIQASMPIGSLLPDGVHLNSIGYDTWTPALLRAIDDPSS